MSKVDKVYKRKMKNRLTYEYNSTSMIYCGKVIKQITRVYTLP